MNSITKYILFLFLILYSLTSVQSQNKVIDSLKLELENHQEKDTMSVKLLNELAYLYYSVNTNTTF